MVKGSSVLNDLATKHSGLGFYTYGMDVMKWIANTDMDLPDTYLNSQLATNDNIHL